MTRSAPLCFLLALMVTLSPQSQAGEKCIRLTNFCDTIAFNTSGSIAYGNWDWGCIGDYATTSVLGNAKKSPDLATRPVPPFEPYLWCCSTEFLFKPGKLFDLWGTEYDGLYNFQTNQPFTITSGACRPADVDRSKPSLTLLRSQAKVASKSVPNRCVHFSNFCDTINLANSGAILYGDWDWQCIGDYQTSNIIGNAAPPPQLTTRPGYPPPPYPYWFAYSAQFSFKPNNLFDLYLTSGVSNGLSLVRRNQPYNISQGACNADDLNTSKPKIMGP